MKTLFEITKLNDEQAKIFDNYFLKDGKFCFEGCWLRNQRPENAKKSGYIDETTARRRYVHFYDTYVDNVKNGEHFLSLADYYLYVTNTLPVEEIKAYENKIFDAIKQAKFEKIDDELFAKGNTEIIIKKYKNHPQNIEVFPENYESLDVVIKSKGYAYQAIQDRMWKLSRKMYRIPDQRENPTYTRDVRDILKYLPAQIEMGCGPSIGANIPPLYKMHELYKVQNHDSGRFYFGEQDDLIYNVILNEQEMRNKFADVPIRCISAELTDGYEILGELYQKGYFKGTVFNNNFDRIVRRMDIPEKILRIYDIDKYIIDAQFDDNVKSLVCMGCHADRRQIQRQARERGLKIIYIDPEGYQTKDGFEQYLIEGPKNKDIILNLPFEKAMKDLKEILK